MPNEGLLNPERHLRSDFAAGVLAQLRDLTRGESGQTLVLAALAMVVLVGFLGLSIDAGQLRYEKRRLQNVADAAALAGALELGSCAGTSNCAAMRQAAQNAVAENGFTGSVLLTNCAGLSGARLEVLVNNAPCANANDPNRGNNGYVEVVVSEPQPTTFARVLGINSVRLMARGEAARSGKGNCIYALDPNGSAALHVDFAAEITTTCGIVVESTSANAFACDLFGRVVAPNIAIAGGYYSFLCSLHPRPKTRANIPAQNDPLASLPAPSMPACGTSTASPYFGSSAPLTITGNAVLYPDAAYCGGIEVKPGANVTFMPGTFILKSQSGGSGGGGSGGLTIDMDTNVVGNGVTFYNYGPTGGITFKYSSYTCGAVRLVAPTSGAYAGILFFQDPANTTQAKILGTSSFNTVLQGTYYFPRAKVLFAFDGLVDYNILVAYDIEFALFTHGSNTTSSGFSSNYSSLANGSPVTGSGVVVVE